MSYAEREVMRITDLKIKRKHEKELEKEELLGLIDKIELDNAILEYNIQSLNPEWYKLIELKYKFKKNCFTDLVGSSFVFEHRLSLIKLSSWLCTEYF